MDQEVDYSTYSYRELCEAYQSIDKVAFAQRAQTLQQYIDEHPDNPTNETASQASEGVKNVRVKFFGNGQEFFKIWIVNILLTILTLGIYSAWAKVRTNRYFYSNIDIDGHRLAYLAEPIQILKGRIIAVVLFAIYYGVGIISPIAQLVVTLALVAISPFLIRLSLRFKFRMTAYRNVRFNFCATNKTTFLLFSVLPVAIFSLLGGFQFAIMQFDLPSWLSSLSIIAIFALVPLALKIIDHYIYSHASFGNKIFTTQVRASEYYTACIVTFLLAVFLIAVLFIAVSIFAGVSFMSFGEGNIMGAMTLLYFVVALSYITIIFTVSSFYTAWIRNHLYSNTRIEDVCQFQSDISTKDLVWLRVSNLFLIVFTLGLGTAWAQIRTARLFAKSTSVGLLPGADSVIGERSQSSAVAEEVSDIFDFDIGIA